MPSEVLTDMATSPSSALLLGLDMQTMLKKGDAKWNNGVTKMCILQGTIYSMPLNKTYWSKKFNISPYICMASSETLSECSFNVPEDAIQIYDDILNFFDLKNKIKQWINFSLFYSW